MLGINATNQYNLNRNQNVKFGSNSIRTLSKMAPQPIEDFFGIQFLQSNSNPKTYTSVQEFTQKEAKKIASSLTNLRNGIREMLKHYGPEQFNVWAKTLIKNDDLECDIKCLTPEAKTSKLSLTRFQDRGQIDLFDSRINEEMRVSLSQKVKNHEIPAEIKMDAGETWTIAPEFDGNFPGLDIYETLKFSKKA